MSARISELLAADPVDLHALAETVRLVGCPDQPRSVRPRVWRLLLGYEPPEQSSSRRRLRQERELYYTFVNELLVDPFLEAAKSPPKTEARTRDLQSDNAQIDALQHSKSIGKDAGARSGKSSRRAKAAASKRMAATNIDSDPLDARFDAYHADNLILEQIDKDVRRTLPEIAFFQQEVPVSHMSPLSPHIKARMSLDTERPLTDFRLEPELAPLEEENIPDEHRQPSQTGIPHKIKTRRTIFARIRHLNRDFGAREHGSATKADDNKSQRIMQNRTSMDEEEVSDLHWEAVERILFIYAKLNPGIGYVQGMNELLFPIYYVLANDDSSHQVHAEADVFFTFTALMTECRELFERTWDHEKRNSDAKGIAAVLAAFMARLEQHDGELHDRLIHQDIDPTYFAFRWFCCLFAQVFALPEVIRLWDSILAGKVTDTSLLKGHALELACAMLVQVRERILRQDFAENVKMLQQYPERDDVAAILSCAEELRKQSRQSGSSSPCANFAQRLLSTPHAYASAFPSLKSLSGLLPRSAPTGTIDSKAAEQRDDEQLPVHHVPATSNVTEDKSRLSLDLIPPALSQLVLPSGRWLGISPTARTPVYSRDRQDSHDERQAAEEAEEDRAEAELVENGGEEGGSGRPKFAQLRNKSSFFMRRAAQMLNHGNARALGDRSVSDASATGDDKLALK
ncbi:hypothetical protein PYCC9005_000255 [Savitreella phatthalungensis]